MNAFWKLFLSNESYILCNIIVNLIENGSIQFFCHDIWFIMNSGHMNIYVMHRSVSSLFVKLLKTIWNKILMKIFQCSSEVSANNWTYLTLFYINFHGLSYESQLRYLYLSKLIPAPGALGAFKRLLLDQVPAFAINLAWICNWFWISFLQEIVLSQFLFAPTFIGIVLSTLVTLEGNPQRAIPKLQQVLISSYT